MVVLSGMHDGSLFWCHTYQVTVKRNYKDLAYVNDFSLEGNQEIHHLSSYLRFNLIILIGPTEENVLNSSVFRSSSFPLSSSHNRDYQLLF